MAAIRSGTCVGVGGVAEIEPGANEKADAKVWTGSGTG